MSDERGAVRAISDSRLKFFRGCQYTQSSYTGVVLCTTGTSTAREVAIRLTVQPEKSWMTETTAASCRQRTGGRWMLAGVRYDLARPPIALRCPDGIEITRLSALESKQPYPAPLQSASSINPCTLRPRLIATIFSLRRSSGLTRTRIPSRAASRPAFRSPHNLSHSERPLCAATVKTVTAQSAGAFALGLLQSSSSERPQLCDLSRWLLQQQFDRR